MLVDTVELVNQIQVRAGEINEAFVSLRDPQTYHNGIWDFEFDISHIIPAEGSI
jgi:hypothetical protein